MLSFDLRPWGDPASFDVFNRNLDLDRPVEKLQEYFDATPGVGRLLYNSNESGERAPVDANFFPHPHIASSRNHTVRFRLAHEKVNHRFINDCRRCVKAY